MKEDIRDFVEAHQRMQAIPPKLPACLDEVWKQLQKFSMEDPLSFYELALSIQAMLTFPKAHADEGRDAKKIAQLVPASPWRERIIFRGFASFEEPPKGDGFVIHDLVHSLFAEHILPPKPAPKPPPAAAPTATQFIYKNKKKGGKKKK